MGLHVSNAPYVFSRDTTRVLMLDVVIAMLPTALVGVWFFGLRALLHLVIGVASAVAAEYAYQRLTGKPVRIGDCSAIVTGMLVALNMPAPAPLWLPLIGSVAAIVLVKELFGGIGGNFMNPALTARAILMISWPVAMTSYTLPVYSLMPGVDAVSSATVLGGLEATPMAMFLGMSLSDPWLRQLKRSRTPAVLYDNYVKVNPTTAYIGVDNFEAMRLSVSYLKKLGRRSIG